jgi:acetyltransferase-like isoleucine patch superfamily enzyme
MNYPISTYFRVCVFQTIWGFVKYIPAPLGDILRYAVLKVFMREIHTFWLRPGITIWWPEKISIGISSLNEDIHLNGYGGINIGDRVLIGHRTTFFSDEHKFEDPDTLIWYQGRNPAPIFVEDDVYIGCNVVILSGITIGKGSIIGAGSIVTRDIPPYSIAVGSPAKVVRQRGEKFQENHIPSKNQPDKIT